MIVKNEFKLALQAVKIASKYILQKFKQKNFITTEKSPDDYVTEVDLEAQKIIKEVLSAKSNYPIIGEENLFSHYGQDIVWVIDPLDGTVNFINNIPIFACAVSLINLKDFTAYVGVINLPFYKLTYSAYYQGGAFLNDKKLLISHNHQVNIAVVRNRKGTKLAAAELKNITHFRNFGSASYELTMLAEQKINLYYDDATAVWDFAAGKAIIEELGIKMTVEPYNSQDLILSKYKVKAKLNS